MADAVHNHWKITDKNHDADWLKQSIKHISSRLDNFPF